MSNLNFKKSSLNEVITIPVEIILCIVLIIISLSQFPKTNKKQTIKFTIFSLYHSTAKLAKKLFMSASPLKGDGGEGVWASRVGWSIA